jgi:hypothetical protein
LNDALGVIIVEADLDAEGVQPLLYQRQLRLRVGDLGRFEMLKQVEGKDGVQEVRNESRRRMPSFVMHGGV